MTIGREISWNRRLGGIGEYAIETRLRYFSNPMKIPPEHDVGIDFYCELNEKSVLSSKMFLVQAKGTKHFDKRWGRSFDKAIIQFWLSQFLPLYIIVHDDVSKDCYWMSIEEKRDSLTEKLRSDKTKTIYLKIDRTRVLRLDHNAEFVNQVKQDLKSLDFRLNLMRGTPQPIGDGYVKRIPMLFLLENLKAIIRDRIRISMLFLINDYLLRKDVANANILTRFLTRFDKSHYDHFVLFGQICTILGKKEEACSSYKQAIEICKDDPNWDLRKRPIDPSIEDLILSIEKEMSKLGCGGA